MSSYISVKQRYSLTCRRLDMYLEAEQAILDGAQSYAIGSRNLTRANLAEVQEMISKLLNEKEALESQMAGGGRRKSVGVVPRDW